MDRVLLDDDVQHSADLKPLAFEKAISFRVNTTALRGSVPGDKDKLHQVLTNLIHNAIKFTPERGEISIVGETRPDGVVICVSDTDRAFPMRNSRGFLSASIVG